MFWLRNKKIIIFDYALLSRGLSKTLYSKYSKILSLFSFYSQKNVGFRGWNIHKMLVRTASREDPDQTASPEAA